MKYVITLNRQFGSLGRQVAQKVAQILDIEYYDRDIVDATAKKMGMLVSEVSSQEKQHGRKFFNMQFPLGDGNSEIKDKIFDEQEKIIMNLADKGSCIIVGRCADYILRNNDNVLNVFVYASYGNRIKNSVDKLDMEPEEALKRIKEVDKSRDNYHSRYAKYLPNDLNHIHAMLDSGTLGVDGTAQAIAQIAREHFRLE